MAKTGEALLISPLLERKEEIVGYSDFSWSQNGELRDAVEVTLHALAVQGGADAFEMLLPLLRSDQHEIARAAAKLLPETGDPRTFDALVAAVEDEAAERSHNALPEALAKTGGDRAFPYLLKLARVAHIGDALAEIGLPVFDRLIATLESEDFAECCAAIHALGRIGDPRAVEPLLGVINHEKTVVRECAAESLALLQDARAVDPLVGLLKDDSANIRLAAVEALGQLGDARAIEPLVLLYNGLHSPDGLLWGERQPNIPVKQLPEVIQKVLKSLGWSEHQQLPETEELHVSTSKEPRIKPQRTEPCDEDDNKGIQVGWSLLGDIEVVPCAYCGIHFPKHVVTEQIMRREAAWALNFAKKHIERHGKIQSLGDETMDLLALVAMVQLLACESCHNLLCPVCLNRPHREGHCIVCSDVLTEDAPGYADTKTSQGMEYFEDEIPDSDALCSDNECPCPEVAIPRGTGYLYISQEIVNFRRQYPKLEDARRAKRQGIEDMRKTMGIQVMGYRLGPILVCEQGARLRNLHLETAAADARHWWQTGQVPLRATPIEGEKSDETKVRAATESPEWTGTIQRIDPVSSDPRSAILCVCKECKTRYVLGVNAVVTTLDEAMGRLRAIGGFYAGTAPSNVPDMVGLEYRKDSWPEGVALPEPTGEIPQAVISARQQRQARQWECNKCKATQPYLW